MYMHIQVHDNLLYDTIQVQSILVPIMVYIMAVPIYGRWHSTINTKKIKINKRKGKLKLHGQLHVQVYCSVQFTLLD